MCIIEPIFIEDLILHDQKLAKYRINKVSKLNNTINDYNRPNNSGYYKSLPIINLKKLK